MADRSSAGISRSLAPLRDVVASLSAASTGALPSNNDRRRLVRRVRAAGSSALPALLRALTSSREGEARWAAWLLQRVAPVDRARVAERVSRMLEEPRLGPAERARAESLLDGLVDMGIEGGVGDLESEIEGAIASAAASDSDVPGARNPAEPLPGDHLEGGLDVNGVLQEIGEHGEQIRALCEQIEHHPGQDTWTAGRPSARRGGRGDVDGLPEPCERATLDAARPYLEGERDLPEVSGPDAARDPATDLAADPGDRRRRIDIRAPRRDPRATGFALLERGDLPRARTALAQAVAAVPDDGEALSYLGVCLLQLGEPLEALVHLERACALDPEEALHHWNIAAAAKAADRMCRGYQALERYLGLPDGFAGHAARHREARRFLASYEKLIQSMHPGVALADVLIGEEQFQRAFADLADQRFAEAVRGFRGVLALLPHHYPSWGNLGVAELALGNQDEATHCLQRALELKPDYEVARVNLEALETRH